MPTTCTISKTTKNIENVLDPDYTKRKAEKKKLVTNQRERDLPIPQQPLPQLLFSLLLPLTSPVVVATPTPTLLSLILSLGSIPLIVYNTNSETNVVGWFVFCVFVVWSE